MAYVTVPGPPQTTLSTYLARAQDVAGLSSADVSFVWDDFVLSVNGTSIPSWVNSLTGTASINMAIAGAVGGVPRIASGATAASQALIYTATTFAPALTTKAWYFAFRAKIPTAIDAQAVAAVGLQAGGTYLMAGFNGPLDGANLGVQHSGGLGAGSFLSFAVAKDSSYHVYEVWGTGTSTMSARLDGASAVSATLSSPPVDGFPTITVKNGTTAADRQLDLDWVFYAAGR